MCSAALCGYSVLDTVIHTQKQPVSVIVLCKVGYVCGMVSVDSLLLLTLLLLTFLPPALQPAVTCFLVHAVCGSFDWKCLCTCLHLLVVQIVQIKLQHDNVAQKSASSNFSTKHLDRKFRNSLYTEYIIYTHQWIHPFSVGLTQQINLSLSACVSAPSKMLLLIIFIQRYSLLSGRLTALVHDSTLKNGLIKCFLAFPGPVG